MAMMAAREHTDGLGNNWNALERVAHIFHMRDLWARIRRSYVITYVTSPAVCRCLTDTAHNGIRTKLETVAQEYTHAVLIDLHEWGSKIPKLTLQTWPEWKKRLSFYYDQQSVRDAATFLRCAL